MKDSFSQLKEVWTELGHDDPLWAVASHSDKRNQRWDLEDFLATGKATVSEYRDLLGKHAGAEDRFPSVLDFGCGVGRLTLAWAERADRVVGVDISESMIAHARRLAAPFPHVEFVLNHKDDLSVFPDNTFSLVSSHICLQHMPWTLARRYVAEFGRVCRPGGWVAFQLPARRLTPSRLPAIRQWIIDHLPFGLGAVYRKWKHGSSVIFEMHYTPADDVVRVAAAAGLVELHRQPDHAAGPGIESYLYVFRKSSGGPGKGIERTGAGAVYRGSAAPEASPI